MPVTSVPPVTPGVAPGSGTTEFKLTLLTTAVSAVVSVLTVIHPGFQMDGGTQATIVSAALVVIGFATSVYSHVRGKVKTAALTSGQSS